MTAMTLERRPVEPLGDGGAPARRAVTRWAWRMFRLEWRRQLLVLVLLIVAVAATVVGLGVATAAAGLGPSPVFGTANTIMVIPGGDPSLASDISAIHSRAGAVDVIEHETVPVPGSVSTVDLRAENPHGVFDHVTLHLDAGRYPAGAGEVAVTRGVADTFGLHLGSQWSAARKPLNVVGIVENPLDLLDQFALVAPDQITSPSEVSVLVSAKQDALRSFRLPSGLGVGIDSRGSGGAAAAEAAVLALGTLGLIFVGLIAAAGFAVIASRRLRALGILGAVGATARHVRLVMLANGAVVGATSAATGIGLGVLAWLALAPTLQAMIDKHVDRFSLPWWAVGAAGALTLLTAVIAAGWPARSVARMPVVAALSGRPPRPQPSHRFAASGGLVFGAGIVLLAFAEQHRALFVVGGTLLTVVGLLLLAPLAIRGLAAAVRNASIATRLALRDLVRYQARSGAALGAITLAIGIAATIAISSAAAQEPTGPGNLPANQLMLYLSPPGGLSQIPPIVGDQQQALDYQVNRLANAIGASSVTRLEEAYDPQDGIWPAQPGGGGGHGQPAGYPAATLAEVIPQPHGGIEITSPYTVYIATAAVLAHYGIQPSQLGATSDVITSHTSVTNLRLFVPTGAPGAPSGRPQPVQSRPRYQIMAQLPAYTSAPGILITPHALKDLGLQAIPAGCLIRTRNPLTPAQITNARNVAAGAGLYVETRQPQQSNAALRNWSTAAGILLALGVLAMTVGLIRSETANDLRTLTAAGAPSRTRRALTGATSAALALLGAWVGTAGSYAALLAWHRSNLKPLDQVPVANLIVILVGLPLIAAAGGWLLAGRQPPAISRRPIE